MAYMTESLEAPRLGQTLSEPSQFDLPSKEFVGYDPKGTTSVTGSPLAAKEEIPKQVSNVEAEPAVDAGPQAPEETVTLAPKASAIFRKEQAQRQKEQQLARREKELADKIEAGEKYLKLQERLKAKDYSAVDELGLSSNELASYEVDKLASQDPAEQRARKLEEEIANLKKAQEERSIEEYKHNQILWKQALTDTFKDAEKYPESNYAKSKGTDVEQLALQLINDSFDEDGIELNEDKAAEYVEEYFKDRAKFFEGSPTLSKNKASADKVLGPPKGSTKTITQTMTTTPKTAPASKPFHLMSESEQIAEAIRKVQAAKLNR